MFLHYIYFYCRAIKVFWSVLPRKISHTTRLPYLSRLTLSANSVAGAWKRFGATLMHTKDERSEIFSASTLLIFGILL